MFKNIVKKFGADLILSVSAMVLFNGVIQFVLYPYLTARMGAEKFGVVIYLLAVISVMGSFGSGANYSRMVVSAKREYANGDYNFFFVIVAGISLAVSAVALVALKSFAPLYFIGYAVLTFVTVLRYYGDVEFRQTCNFKGYFLYYLLISAGYCVGVLCYRLTGSWLVTMLLGEGLAVAFVAVRGSIFRPDTFKKSVNFRQNTRSVWELTAANLVHAIVLNTDRILIIFFIGSFEVTVFYAATLVGKIAALITVPLEGLVISYLNKYEGRLDYRLYFIFSSALLGVAAVLTAGSTVASYILVPFMYSEVYDQAKAYFIVANFGQVMFFTSTVLITFILKISGESSQLRLNLIYLAAFLAVVIPCIAIWGLWGLAWGIAAVNLLRFLTVAVYGLKKLKKA